MSEYHQRKQPFLFSQFYSNDWANKKLRFAIGTLQGEYESSLWKRRLQTALICKDELLAHSYFLQAEKIDFWIHRLQPSKAGLLEKRDEASL